MTGVTSMAGGDRQRKRLELLHASIPGASTFGLLVNPRNPQADVQVKDTVSAAQAAGLEIKLIRASAGQDLAGAFAELAQSPARGLVIADDDLFLSAGPELGALAGNRRIPAIFESPGFAVAGGLMSYGTRLAEFYHQAGSYSGMVLAGAGGGSADLSIDGDRHDRQSQERQSARHCGAAGHHRSGQLIDPVSAPAKYVREALKPAT